MYIRLRALAMSKFQEGKFFEYICRYMFAQEYVNLFSSVIGHENSYAYLIDVVARRQRQLPLRIQDTKGGEQLASVIARELCPNRVYGDIHRASVSFKRQHLTHELGRSAPKGCTELSKVFQVSLQKSMHTNHNIMRSHTSLGASAPIHVRKQS